MSIKTQNIINKTKGQLQAELALLGSQCESLRQEFNVLSSKKAQLEKNIAVEQALYDSMVLKTTAEMQLELEDKVLTSKGILQELEKVLENVKKQTITKREEFDRAVVALDDLKAEIERTRLQFNKDSRAAKEELERVKLETLASRTELGNNVKSADKAKKEEDQARKNKEAHAASQAEYAKFLERKARDLSIWQERLEPAFKQKFPNGEMSFV